MKVKLADLVGLVFNRLTVIYAYKKNIYGYNLTHVVAECSCGSGSKEYRYDQLKSGNTKSCGCYQKECTREANIKYEKYDYRLYKIWEGIKARCYNMNKDSYKYYGGRGITICEEWKNDFVNFYDWAMSNGYQDSLEIDRIDNDENYSPRNCKWSTRLEQNNNKRNNIKIRLGTESKTLSDWCKYFGIRYTTVRSRMRRGCGIRNLFDPVIKRHCDG